MGAVAGGDIGRIVVRQRRVAGHPGIAAMTVGAAEHHGGRRMHGLLVAVGVAGDAARALGVGDVPFLGSRRRWGADQTVVARHRLLAFGGDEWRSQEEGYRHPGESRDPSEDTALQPETPAFAGVTGTIAPHPPPLRDWSPL
jgi:hypothetical protein